MKKWYDENQGKINTIKKHIWVPKKPEEYQNLNVRVIPTNNSEWLLNWKILREMNHTAVWHASPGRMGRYVVVDERENPFNPDMKIYKYLGIISIASDFIGVGGRDEHIGWSLEQRKGGMLNHTAMGSSIAPTQPLGFNYAGGKLIALMTCSDVVETHWNNRYPETLAGITTTSLFGGYSQYTRLKYWRKCTSSEGKVKIEPTEDVYDVLREWMRKNHPEHYPYNPENGIISHPKSRIISFLSKELDVPLPNNNAPRGVYWCALYENTNKFLRQEHKELGKKKFDNRVEPLTELWKEKYASKRIKNLVEKEQVSKEKLFYDDLIGATWKEVRERYPSYVGK